MYVFAGPIAPRVSGSPAFSGCTRQTRSSPKPTKLPTSMSNYESSCGAAAQAFDLPIAVLRREQRAETAVDVGADSLEGLRL